MIEINLKERIQVVRPFDRAAFGRFVATKVDLVRRRLLVDSFNAISDHFRGQFDFIDELLSHENFVRALDLSREGIDHLCDTGRLREEDFNLHLLRRRQPHEGLDELIRIMNSACSFRSVVEGPVEFYLADVPYFPGSVLRMRMASGKHESVLEDPRAVKQNFKEMLFPGFAGGGVWHRNRVYSESAIRDLYVKYFGAVNFQTIKERVLEEYHMFQPVIRPSRFDHCERLYTHTGIDHYRSRTVPVYVSRLRGNGAAALNSEVDELRQEGRIELVRHQKKNTHSWLYFTPQALAEGLENGYVREQEEGRYVAGDLILKFPHYSEDEPDFSAARVFLDYLHDRRLSPRARAAFPFLAESIEVLRSSPSGAEEYFEAAELAARYGVSENYVNALLLRSNFREEAHSLYETRYWYLNQSQTYRYQDFLFERMREKGLTMVDCELQVDSVKLILDQLARLQAANLDQDPPKSAAEVEAFLIKFNSLLNGTNDPRHLQAAYFATVIARLHRVGARGLAPSLERQLRIITATMAERLGFQEFAAEIRDQLFRIQNPRQYQRMKALVERTYGLTYSELEAHLGKTADLVREVLSAVGIDSWSFDSHGRVKRLYSAWEKMQSLGVSRVGLLKDLLGISVESKNDAQAYRIMSLLQQAFEPLTAPAFEDRHGLLRYLRRQHNEIFRDQIQAPRPSGFSALFYLCLTELGLPMELQVTTRERAKINKDGLAAHWKHKIRREVKATYGIEIGELPDLKI